MKEVQKIKKMVTSLAKDNEKVLVIDRKENWNRWHEFKCLTADDVSTLQDDSFDLIVVNDFTFTKSDFLTQLRRVGNKFIILSPFVTKITDSSKQLIEDITKNELDEIKLLNNIKDKEELLQRRKLEYVKLEKEDLLKIDPNNYFFNLALIQNLKTQIAEKEKEIVTRNKDIKLLENRIKELENYLSISEKVKKKNTKYFQKLVKIKEKKLFKFKKQIQKRDQEIQKRDQEILEFKKQINQEIQKRDQETLRLNKLRDQEIIKLKEIEEETRKKLIFNFGQSLHQKEEEINKLREDFERRKKELEEEKNLRTISLNIIPKTKPANDVGLVILKL
jgi:hypothetical protein